MAQCLLQQKEEDAGGDVSSWSIPALPDLLEGTSIMLESLGCKSPPGSGCHLWQGAEARGRQEVGVPSLDLACWVNRRCAGAHGEAAARGRAAGLGAWGQGRFGRCHGSLSRSVGDRELQSQRDVLRHVLFFHLEILPWQHSGIWDAYLGSQRDRSQRRGSPATRSPSHPSR